MNPLFVPTLLLLLFSSPQLALPEKQLIAAAVLPLPEPMRNLCRAGKGEKES